MATLEYSPDALNVLDKFHQVDSMVFVEGDDDVVFWETLFGELSEMSVKVQSLGGREEVQKVADAIIDGKTQVVVALDADYQALDPVRPHENILHTFGHSIENTLVCAESIQQAVLGGARLSKRDFTIRDCEQWLDSFDQQIKPLFIYELENAEENHGKVVMGDNCSRFMTSKVSATFCTTRITEHLKNIGFDVPRASEDAIKARLEENEFRIRELVRGHFLFSAAWRFIIKSIRKFKPKATVSFDALFATLSSWLSGKFSENHPHYEHYKSQIASVA